jgi:hypothetical protein
MLVEEGGVEEVVDKVCIEETEEGALLVGQITTSLYLNRCWSWCNYTFQFQGLNGTSSHITIVGSILIWCGQVTN